MRLSTLMRMMTWDAIITERNRRAEERKKKKSYCVHTDLRKLRKQCDDTNEYPIRVCP